MPSPPRPGQSRPGVREAPPALSPLDAFLARHPYASEATVVWVLFFSLSLAARATAPPGFAWDEGFHLEYGLNHLNWFSTITSGGLTPAGVKASWSAGREYPPLAPLAVGLAHQVLGVTNAASLVAYAFLGTGVFVFLAGRWGRWAGRLAAVSLAAMPRVFAHSQLAESDLLMALTWFLAVWGFVRALERPGLRREVLAGAAFGAALLTKMNAFFIPLILAPWAVAVYRRRALRPLAVTSTLGVVLFFLGWPWMWPWIWRNPVEPVREYLGRSTNRAAILVYYLGRSWRDVDVPFHYPLVMALVTVPIGVVAGAGWGAADGLHRAGRRALTVLLCLNVLGPLVIFGIPGVPVYDGVRLFLHVFPFVACLAGIGAIAAIRHLQARRLPPRLARGAVMVVAALQLVPVVGTLPFGLSYYNLLVGGPAGAARLGFETTYWGDALDSRVIADLKAHLRDAAPEARRVAIFEIPAHQIRPYYDAQLAPELIPVPHVALGLGRPPYDYLIVVCRKGYFDTEKAAGIWDLYRHHTPVVPRHLRYFGSVLVCGVYDVRAWPRQPAATPKPPMIPDGALQPR